MKSIFIIENDMNVRDALCLLIEHQEDMKVVGTANRNKCILAMVCKKKPNVVLLDWYLPGIDGERLIRGIRRCCPAVQIIAMSVRPEHENVAMKMGADDFLLKQLPPDQFISALNTALKERDIR